MKFRINGATVALWLFVFVAVCSFAHADGISVSKDRKHYLDPHTTLKLTNVQRIEVETSRTLTLNNEQMQLLKKKSLRPTKKVEVLSSRYNDCTCDIENVAVWCRPGEVDIMDTFMDKASDPIPTPTPAEMETNTSTSEKMTGEFLILDSKGSMYLHGKRLSMKDLKQLIDKIAHDAQRDEGFLNFDVPPPIDLKTDAAIQVLIKETAVYCKKKCVSFYAMGLEE